MFDEIAIWYIALVRLVSVVLPLSDSARSRIYQRSDFVPEIWMLKDTDLKNVLAGVRTTGNALESSNYCHE